MSYQGYESPPKSLRNANPILNLVAWLQECHPQTKLEKLFQLWILGQDKLLLMLLKLILKILIVQLQLLARLLMRDLGQRCLVMFSDLLEKHSDELATLETWDNGKPFSQAAQAELPMIVRIIRYYAGWVDKIHGPTVPADGPHHVQTLHGPIGVAGQIIPWNFPLLMFAWKIGPELATGNTVVIKRAEQTPLSAIYAAKLLQEKLPQERSGHCCGFNSVLVLLSDVWKNRE